MKISPMNILFLILLINHGSILCKALKKLLINQEGSPICTKLDNSTEKLSVLDNLTNSAVGNKIYFLFFLTKVRKMNEVKDFYNEVNKLFDDVLQIKFFCTDELDVKTNNTTLNHTHLLSNRTMTNISNPIEIYIMKNHKIIESSSIKQITQSYFLYLIDKFNLKDQIETKVLNDPHYQVFKHKYIENYNRTSFVEMSSNIELLEEKEIDTLSYTSSVNNLILMQTNGIGSIDPKGVFILAEQTKSRLLRFIFAIILVLVFSFSCFFFIKFSIDWATASKAELNKMKDARLREITEEINNRFAYTKTEF